MSERRVQRAQRVNGTVIVGGDKSISHRALLLGALARGRSYIGNLSPAADVQSTLRCLQQCGAGLVVRDDSRVACDGVGPGRSLHTPGADLDCGNSGTTMRLLTGAIAGHEMQARLTGDDSLRRRPMERVAEPLRAMGAEVTSSGGVAPLQVTGHRRLRGIEYTMPVASAQVKSSILLAALSADSPVAVIEPAPTRDHTERMLRMCGADVVADGSRVVLTPGELDPFGLRIPGDLSTAAFFLALAASRPGWEITCPEVTLNPGRTGVLDVLRQMGALVEIEEQPPAGEVEPVGTVTVRGGGLLHGVSIEGAMIARCIDELPVLAVLATQAEGLTAIRGAGELRHKESDRIASVATGLRALGVDVDETDDGLCITGPAQLRATRLESGGDHRLAMAWAIAGCLAEGETTIVGADCVAVSAPHFFEDLAAVVS